MVNKYVENARFLNMYFHPRNIDFGVETRTIFNASETVPAKINSRDRVPLSRSSYRHV